MSNERFIIDMETDNHLGYDTTKGEWLTKQEMVELLNKQDYAITVKQMYIEKLEKMIEEGEGRQH